MLGTRVHKRAYTRMQNKPPGLAEKHLPVYLLTPQNQDNQKIYPRLSKGSTTSVGDCHLHTADIT